MSTKRLAFIVGSLFLGMYLIATINVDAVSKIQVNTDANQTLSNKTFDSSNTYNGGTFNAPTLNNADLSSTTLTSPTLTTPTISSGNTTFSALAANSQLYLNGSKVLTATANPTNGQLLIGSTGAVPVLGTLTGTANQVVVTNSAGGITLSTPQNIGTGSSPTFAGLTLSGLTASRYLKTDGSSVVTTQATPIPVSDGGTGLTGTPSNGQLAIGNGVNYTLGTLTAGPGLSITNAAGAITISPIPRGYLSGYIMSTAGSSSTMTIGAGQATDTTYVSTIVLGSSIAKTTGSWAVGTGNGCLDTGAVANSTWYHFFAILRPDTGVVDVLCSTSPTSPTMPSNYTLARNIGAGKTNGSAQWLSFTQDGDTILWSAAVLDVDSTNPGTSAITSTLSVPTGVRVRAIVNQTLTTGAGGASACLLSSPDQADAAASVSALPLANIYAPASGLAANRLEVVTNTSAQIRRRCSFSDGSVIHRIATVGYVHRRGRDS